MMMNGVISTAGVFQYKRLYLHKCYIYIYYYIIVYLYFLQCSRVKITHLF